MSDQFAVTVTSDKTGTAASVTVTAVSNGDYQIKYTLSTAGNYTMVIKV